ncbi:hypothetical protein [Bacteroides faecalis]|nr:hypothetical protein [Bacteroides faecalis]
MPHKKGNSQYFTQLIVRLQMKGYQPIILIDSLDSFLPSHILNRFHLLPDNIPCFCTSLPEVIPPVLVQKMKFKVMNIDSPTEQEARMVITEVMKKNNKQFPELLVEELLALKDEKEIPSYSSPLWLQMCLSILLELGEEDFKAIHREQLEQEDEKIEAFLLKTIKGFPTDVNGLFQQLLQLTYHYFNKDLSQEILSLIRFITIWHQRERYGMFAGHSLECSGICKPSMLDETLYQ